MSRHLRPDLRLGGSLNDRYRGDEKTLKLKLFKSTSSGGRDSMQCSGDSDAFFRALDQFRRAGHFCDIVIRSGDDGCVGFRAHKAFLAACSPYFRAMFTGKMSERSQKEVQIQLVSSDVLARLLDWAYTGQTELSEDNVHHMLIAADMLDFSTLVCECANYMAKQLSVTTCVGVHKFASQYAVQSLKEEAYYYTMYHFGEVSYRSAELLDLPFDEFVELIGSEKLQVRDESIVFRCMCRWIGYNVEDRKQHVAELLSEVRMGQLSDQYFMTNIKQHPYLAGNEKCSSIVAKVIQMYYELESLDVILSDPYCRKFGRARQPYDLMFAVAGWGGESPETSLEVFDACANRWQAVPGADDMNGPRAYFGCQVIDGCIFVFGGFNGNQYFNSCRRFDVDAMVWSEAAPMHSRRCYVASAAAQGMMYAIGGFNGNFRMNSVERYDAKFNHWSHVSPMLQTRSDCGACALLDGSRIVVSGGFDGQLCLSSCEMYTIDLDQWTIISAMKNVRSGVASTVYKGEVFVVGGYNGSARLKNVERYSPKTDTWHHVPSMGFPRSNPGLGVCHGHMLAVGGFDGVRCINTVETYDETKGVWHMTTPLQFPRSALSVCTVPRVNRTDKYLDVDREKLLLTSADLLKANKAPKKLVTTDV